jgi:MFS family permease
MDDTPPPPVESPEAVPAGPPINRWMVIGGVALPLFLASADQTIVATALPAIAKDLGGLTNISWVVIAYLLFQTVAAPIYGRLSDLKGRRKMMLIALAVLTLASVLCASATSMTVLIIARALQGCGGGGLQTLSFSIIGETIPPRERARYQAWLSSVYAASSVMGPLMGGWLSQTFSWHAVFWSQIPLGILAIGIATRLPALNRA